MSPTSYVFCAVRCPVLVHSYNTWNIQILPCGGGVEYPHRSSASRRRRRKGNPVPGGITWPPCSWGI
jgi:hypothetical protein